MHSPGTTVGIGVDIGGTFTRVAFVDGLEPIPESSGTGISPVFSRASSPPHTCYRDRRLARVFAQRCWPTSETPSLDKLLDRIARTIRELTGDQHRLYRDVPIGMAIPGTLDEPRDRAVRCVNVSLLEGRAVGDALRERSRRMVTLCTDAEAATWAEYLDAVLTARFLDQADRETRNADTMKPRRPRGIKPAVHRGNGAAAPRFVHLRIGTGVACGVVIDGVLVRLDENRETHPPFLVVDDTATAAACRCGLRGCLESIASGVALEASARKLGLGGGVPALGAAWRRSIEMGTASDVSMASAVEALRRAGEAIGTAIGLVADRFRAEVVCLGGGVFVNLPCVIENAIDAYQRSAKLREQEPPTIITQAKLGDDAGVIGAALIGARKVHPAT